MSVFDKLHAKQLSYTPYYCEENIWKLCETIQRDHADELDNCYAIFISNKSEKVPLSYQKFGYQVIWDYHVILIYSRDNISMIYDFDTTLPNPCQFTHYIKNVFVSNLDSPNLQYKFRVVKAGDYLKSFASDRSRMRNTDGSYVQPPPKHSCIQTNNETNNLNKFISMTDDFIVGTVMDFKQFIQNFSK